MSHIPTSEVLHKAADAIEQRGWEQGGGWGEQETPGLCLEGGIIAAMGATVVEDTTALPTLRFRMPDGTTIGQFEIESACPAYRAVREYLGHDEVRPGVQLYHWNDRYDRTQEQVIETLRAAAEVEALKERERRITIERHDSEVRAVL